MSEERDPKENPQPGDTVECYNELMDVWIERHVLARQGCTVLFSIGNDMYSCCVDIWKMMNREGIVK